MSVQQIELCGDGDKIEVGACAPTPLRKKRRTVQGLLAKKRWV